jgi:hypothetical protein
LYNLPPVIKRRRAFLPGDPVRMPPARFLAVFEAVFLQVVFDSAVGFGFVFAFGFVFGIQWHFRT